MKNFHSILFMKPEQVLPPPSQIEPGAIGNEDILHTPPSPKTDSSLSHSETRFQINISFHKLISGLTECEIAFHLII